MSSGLRRGAVFDLAAKKEEILKLEYITQQPGFWDNPQEAARITSTISNMKSEVDEWAKLEGETLELKELFAVAGGDERMHAELEKKMADLEVLFRAAETRTFLSGKYDAGNATLSIYAGAGGQDAEDWAGILLRMYMRYCENTGWKTIELHKHINETGGLKNATFEVMGKNAYGYLKGEQGVHRLVRISPFDANKRRHTSFAFLEVLPDVPAMGVVELDEKDLEYDFARSSGKGGQNVNKRETSVRVTHVPTGVVVKVENERSQAQNKERALGMLRAKLYTMLEASHKKELDELKGGKVAIEWGSQIRSYVLHPYQMVKDHRTGVETAQVEKVLDGDLTEFIEAELKQI